jgi:hypothetical protein
MDQFDWQIWDYSVFGQFIYTYTFNPTPLKFYFKDEFSFGWGQGAADILIDGNVVYRLDKANDPNDPPTPISIKPDTSKKFSTLEIRVKKGPVVIDNAEWMEQFFTQHTLATDFNGTKVMASSFELKVK